MIRAGICSWADKSLGASGFYPRGVMTPAARLAWYAERFDTVEIDSTFYAPADASYAFRWVAGTPKGFKFGVKSFALFTTHAARWSSLPAWLREEVPRDAGAYVRRDEIPHELRVRLFEEFAAPVHTLNDAGKLAYLLFQFPPSFVFSRASLSYIRSIRSIAGRLPLAVEVRSSTWLADECAETFFSELERQNIAYVAVDEPDVGWSVPGVMRRTAEWGSVVRFHGRAEAAWRKRRASVHERFDYEYTREELEEWRDRVRAADERGGTTYLMFNNCVSDKAVRGASMMLEVMGESAWSFGGQRSVL